MPGAYRDDREAARAKIAELQAELDQHRAKRFAITEMKEAVDAIANPRVIPPFSLLSVFCAFLLLAIAFNLESLWLGAIAAVGIVAAISFFVRGNNAPILPPPELDEGREETEEQKLIRFRVAEANTARIQLDEEQKREIEEEERICTALHEEIEQMKRLVDR
jgi:hypothetical protein